MPDPPPTDEAHDEENAIMRAGQTHWAWHLKDGWRQHSGLRHMCSICTCDPDHGYRHGRKLAGA